MSDPTKMSWSTDVIFLRFIADPNHITSVFFCVELQALRRAPVVDRHHASSNPSGDVADVGRLTLLDVLPVISKQTMVNTTMLENVGDILMILGVYDKGPRSQIPVVRQSAVH